MEDTILIKILNQKASEEERIRFFSTLEEDEELRQNYYELKSLWAKSAPATPLAQKEKNEDFINLWNRTGRGRKVYLNFSELRKYAAILIIAILAGAFAGVEIYQFKSKSLNQISQIEHRYSAGKSSLSEVVLNDGTHVWLNAGSSLIYREDFKTGERSAELEGEALFEITHDEMRPFVLAAGELEIVDIGTTFNVKAYPGEKSIETTLIEGKVDIHKAGNKVLEMVPGENAIYSKEEKKLVVRKVSTELITAWTENKFVFRDESLEEIMKELENWYGVEIRFLNQKIKNERFNMTMKRTTTIRSVLKMLRINTNIRYTIQEKEVGKDVIIIR